MSLVFKVKELIPCRFLKTPRQSLFYLLTLLFSFSNSFNPTSAVTPGLELEEDTIVLLKNIAARTYDDAAHDRGLRRPRRAPDLTSDPSSSETLDGISWKKHPFYASESAPSSVGTIYYSEDPKALVVAFHGSWWLKDWLDDFKAVHRPATCLSRKLKGNVHKGFSTLVSDSYNNMITKIHLVLGRPLKPNDEVYFTGHSLGGALAMLAGTAISFNHEFDPHSIKIITFSAPRKVIGDMPFVNQASKRIFPENILCFRTRGDIVPNINLNNFFCSYEPFGTNIEIEIAEKVANHYFQPLPEAAGIDDVWEHPLRSMGVAALKKGAKGAVAGAGAGGVMGGVPGAAAGAVAGAGTSFAKELALTLHSLPADGPLKTAFRDTQYKYRTSHMPVEKLGEFSIGSVERNPFLKSLYNFFL